MSNKNNQSELLTDDNYVNFVDNYSFSDIDFVRAA